MPWLLHAAEIPAATTQMWNLHEVDIHNVIDEVSKLTGKNFIVDPRVQGKVTIISSKPLSSAEIYRVFLAILQVHGYTAVTSGTVTKIVPSADASQSNLHLANANHPGVGDEVVVRIIALQNNSVEQLLPVLRALIPAAGTVNVYPPTNTLIISGSADHVANLAQLAQQIDQANDKMIDILPLRYAVASELVKEIMPLINSTGAAANAVVNLAADDKSNSILISGNANQRTRLRGIIMQLDRRTGSNGNGNTQVIYLHYLKANKLLPILSGIVGNQTQANASSNANPNTESSSNSATIVTANNQQVQIQAEKDNNAVVITAPINIMRMLKSVIAQLDRRPAQVLVEAAIVEIDESRLKQLGVQWGTEGNGIPNISADPDFNVLTGGLGIGFIHDYSIKALVAALARDGSTNILSTPSIIVMDNQKADIRVGKNVPFVTGSYSTNNTGSLNNPYTITKREFVGLELKVIPQINQGNTVRFYIEQQNETISTVGQNGVNQNPITDESRVGTSVLIRDGEILVLGGLISNQLEEINHKVPILGDIPGIGVLFHDKRHSLEKKNLMVFLRPVILYGDHAASAVTDKRYDFERARQVEAFDKTATSGLTEGSAILPARDHQVSLPAPFSVNRGRDARYVNR